MQRHEHAQLVQALQLELRRWHLDAHVDNNLDDTLVVTFYSTSDCDRFVRLLDDTIGVDQWTVESTRSGRIWR